MRPLGRLVPERWPPRRLDDMSARERREDSFASPVRADPSGLPPMLIQVGSEEVLLSDSITFANNAAMAGIEVKLHVAPEMPHAFPLTFLLRPLIHQPRKGLPDLRR